MNLYQRNKVFFKLCTNWNNQSGIGLDVLKSIRIPVPSKLSKQEKITNDIRQIRNTAYKLRDEAINVFNTAKKEIEDMILGGEN